MEEIDDVDGNFTDPFVAAAVANEKELPLSEEQKKKYKKVLQNSLVLYCFKIFSFYMHHQSLAPIVIFSLQPDASEHIYINYQDEIADS